MSFSEDFSETFSTLFADSSLRYMQPNVFISTPMPEQRHAETVVRRLLRTRGHSLDPVQQRAHQAAAVICSAFANSESVRMDSGISNRGHQPARVKSVASRLARRILNQISSRIFRPG